MLQDGSALNSTEIVAVIDVGSSGLRLLIAQGSEPNEWDVLESADQPLALGREVFRKGSIDPGTINRAVEIFKGFVELMAPYGVKRIVAIGTSALRESENREIFINRVMLQTGIEIRVIDGVEANQLTWLAVRESISESETGFKRHNSLIIEVGAGNTDLMILRHGKITSSHALPIGTLRFLQQLDDRYYGNIGNSREIFRVHTYRTVRGMAHELGLDRVSKLVAVGSDARLAAARLGRPITDELSVIKRTDFRDFMEEIESFSPDEIVARLDLPWNEAELLYPALVIFNTFIESTRADEILVPSASIRQGLLVNYAAGRNKLKEIFGTQVLSGSRNLARHYQADLKHAEFVRKQALLIYDTLNAELGLTSYYRLFLEVAAILHDVGSYIGGTSHHKHGQYVIQNSDIFGLSAADKELVAHIVRYHRRAKPQPSHEFYMALNRNDRVVVQKLASLLRVAEALDRSHTQQITISRLNIKKDRLLIHTPYSGDLSIEESGLVEKGNLLEEVFGLRPVLLYDNPKSGR
jgi:exopolyphosphatase/guanosine-5'-triphosphate,3'-diphosphate pyrophosphatase